MSDRPITKSLCPRLAPAASPAKPHLFPIEHELWGSFEIASERLRGRVLAIWPAGLGDGGLALGWAWIYGPDGSFWSVGLEHVEFDRQPVEQETPSAPTPGNFEAGRRRTDV